MDAPGLHLVIAIVLGTLTALVLGARPKARQEGRWLVLEYGRGMRAVALGSLVVPAVALVGVFLVDAEDRTTMLAAFGLLGALSAVLMLEVFRVRVAFSDTGVLASSPWRAHRQIAWLEVQRVSYSASMMGYRIHTRRQGIVRLHAFLSGVPDMLDELARRGVLGAAGMPKPSERVLPDGSRARPRQPGQ